MVGPDLASKDVVSGVGFARRITWLKGERCSEISPIRQLYRDVFGLVLPTEAVRFATPYSVYQEAVLESITTS
jgi:hypothetical protein